MARYLTLLTALVLCIATVSADRQLTATNFIETQSIGWYAALGGGSAPMPLTDPALARTVTGLQPEQIHLTFVNNSAITVSWATGEATLQTSSPANTSILSTYAAAPSAVQYGTSSSSLTSNATGFTTSYYTNYTGFGNSNPHINYTSPLFHHVTLANLKSGTTYFYRVGGASTGYSAVYNFTTGPAAGYPYRLGVVADVGQTYNSSTTMQHLADANPTSYVLVGDYTYADDWLTSGITPYTGFPNNTFNNSYPSPIGTYQPRWDSWFRYTQYLNAKVPLIPNHGNHELEPQLNATYATGLDNGLQFRSYVNRIPVPYNASGSGNPLYYSVNVGPAHIISLSNYDNFLVGSPQYQWLMADLAKVNRTQTPWLLATWHAPWYSSYTTHYKETECMRQAMEDMMYAAGVDIVLNGHLHEYERTNPVYNYTVNECGAVHITMGDGGNIEGLYKTFIDQAPFPTYCPKPNTLPAYQPGPYCPSFVYDTSNAAVGYCPTSQPAWSAFREPAFGHAILTFENSTHALWQWNRNWDAENVFLDEVYIIRDPSCPNQGPIAANQGTQVVGAVATASI